MTTTIELTTPADSASGQQDTAADAREIASRWAAGWNAADATQLARSFTASATYTDLAVGKSFTGPEQITQFKAMSDHLISGLHIQVLKAFGDGDHITIETVYSGHFAGAPTPFAVHGTTVLRMQDGLIATDTDDYSLSTVLALSGLPADWSPAGN